MAFADPQSVTVDTIPVSLPRVSTSDGKSVYRKSDGIVELQVTQNLSGKRNRRSLRLTNNKVSADPFTPSVNVPSFVAVTVTIDEPKMGWTLAEKTALVVALADYLKASTNANTTKLLGGES